MEGNNSAETLDSNDAISETEYVCEINDEVNRMAELAIQDMSNDVTSGVTSIDINVDTTTNDANVQLWVS